MPQILRGRYAEGLIAKGAKRVRVIGNRYWVFQLGDYFYFLGKAGSVRISGTRSVLDSFPANDFIKSSLLASAEKVEKNAKYGPTV